jgi:hypothetical protein
MTYTLPPNLNKNIGYKAYPYMETIAVTKKQAGALLAADETKNKVGVA